MTTDAQSGQTTGDGLRVAIVLPTFNEAENLQEIVAGLQKLDIPGLGFIVVDDGSPDGTGDVADRLAREYDGVFRVIHRSGKLGLGTAYVAGFKEALELGAEFVVQMDADLSHPAEDVPLMLALAEEEADVVIGSRYVPGGGVDPGWSWIRRQISYWGGFGIRLVLGLKIKDTTSGFKVFRRTALEKIGLDRLKLSGYGFQPEVSYRCQQQRLVMAEHPFVFLDRTVGKSKMSLAIILEAFFRLIMLRLFG